MRTLKAFISMFPIVIAFLNLLTLSSGFSVEATVGDSAKYEIPAAFWSSKNPNAVEPQSVTDLKKTDWKLVTVTKVSGTNVTMSVSTKFNNGTQQDSIYTANMTSALTTSKEDSEFGFLIIPAGLSKGDSVRQSAIVINETLTKEFLGEDREVNYAGLRIQVEFETNYEYYWDRQTGFLLKSRFSEFGYVWDDTAELFYETTTVIQIDIIETNLWQTPNPPQLWWLQWGPPVVVVAIVLVTVILVKIRPKTRRKRRKRA